MDRRRKTILVSGTLALVVGGVILLARQGLGMASLWATVLGLPISIIGGVTAVWELLKRDFGGPGIEFIELFDHPAEYFGIGVRVRR